MGPRRMTRRRPTWRMPRRHARLARSASNAVIAIHAVASHHDARAARTAEAAVLYHANQLDAVAATKPVDS